MLSFLSILPQVQFWLLGYFGYIWTFIAAYGIYKTKAILNFKNPQSIEKALGVAIIAFALLVLQGLFFENAGILGIAFNNVLKPIITALGIFILSLVMLGFGVVLYTAKSPKALYTILYNALQEDLKKDMQHIKTSKAKICKSLEKFKYFLLKTKAFFTPPTTHTKKDPKMESTQPSKDSVFEATNATLKNQSPQNTQMRTNEESKIPKESQLRPLTLEELIEQSKHNPPPKESIHFNFSKEEEPAIDFNSTQKDFEEGIDGLRQDVELPLYNNSLENPSNKDNQDFPIRVIPPNNIPQESFNPAQFQMQSMASLENLKRFEKNDFHLKEEQEEPIKLIKKENVIVKSESSTSYTEAAEPISQTKPYQEPPKKQAIKSYPKKLYAATPFSAYYDKEPVGTHNRLIDVENLQKDYPSKSDKNTLPKTIFYYGDKVSTHPLPENTDLKNPIPQPQEIMQEGVEITENTSLQELENMESKKQMAQLEITKQQEQSPKETTPQQPTIQTPQIEEIPQYATIPSVIPTFDYGYTHYKEPMQQISQPVLTQQAQPTQAKPQAIDTNSKHTIESLLQEQAPLQTLQSVSQNTEQLPTQTQIEQTPQPQNAELPVSQTHTIVKTLEENTALLENLEMAQTPQMLESKNYELPKLEFLQEPKRTHIEIDESEIDRKINDLLNKMRVFKIEGDIVRTYSGPIVTTFEFRPSPNVKVSRILTLQDDLAMALRAKTIRIQAPIPGKDVVGIEIPNAQVETIYLREILENDLFKNSLSSLTLALGKDIVGNPFVTDLKKLPHLLIAGTTGSGKSVGINAMILSLLYKNPPHKLKLIMVDPKMVEFSIYNDIPHLLTPVITNPKNAIFALDVAVKEMEQRNALISEARVKNIESYNQKAEMEGFEPFPYIVIIIDELADLMMTGGKEAEASISRLTQMARSSGIHLIVATQRPSVDVVTGLIKANLPSRISYKVGQKIDSKVILDCHGAESLLGNGDMLFAMGGGNVTRLHAPFSTEEEIERIVEFIKAQCPPQYDERFLQKEERTQMQSNGEADDLYEEAKRIMLADGKTSISYIQRRLGIGFNKAANIVEQMQQRGFLSKENSKGVREIIGDKN